MAFSAFIQRFAHKKKEAPLSVSSHIRFKVVIIEFADNVESSGGEVVAAELQGAEGLEVVYFNEPFSKGFLDLESRNLFDFIDKGQTIMDKTGADVLLWGYREGEKLRLNFQNGKQYEKSAGSIISLLDSLYIPSEFINGEKSLPPAISSLIYGAIISAVNPADKECRIHKKFLLKKIIAKLSNDNSAKELKIDLMPFVMNFLGIIYLSYCCENDDEKDFKITQSLFETALKHQDLIKRPLHLGCIYYHLGQLYDYATRYMSRRPISYYKGAISYYQLAQKYLSKYAYPYDYGYICYNLSGLFFSYWRQKEDIQALRDSVFQLREAERIFTYALFPEFWSNIEGEIGRLLSLLGNITKSEEISELAISGFKNQQKVITEKRDPLAWAQIQEHIGEIYYRLGKNSDDKSFYEEALEYFHDALYIYENMELQSDIKKISADIAKTSKNLNAL